MTDSEKKDRRFSGVTFTMEQVENHAGSLSSEYLDILCGNINGWSYADLAERLYLPLGTVKSRLNRARAALAKEINKERQP